MQNSLINPEKHLLPPLTAKVVLCFSLGYFYNLKKHWQGSKVKAFGPSKCFRCLVAGTEITVLGGMLGAGLALLAGENALAAGGKEFISLGTAGWIGAEDWRPGRLVTSHQGIDQSGLAHELGLQPKVDFTPWPDLPPYPLVTVGHAYALTPNRLTHYQSLGASLIEMELAVLGALFRQNNLSLTPLLVLSDGVRQGKWVDCRQSKQTEEGIQQAIQLFEDFWPNQLTELKPLS